MLIPILIVAILLVLYWWFRSPYDGYWEASPAFLTKSNLQFMSAMFRGNKLVLLMTANGKSAVEIYTYEVDDGILDATLVGAKGSSGILTYGMDVSLIDGAMLISKDKTVLASLVKK